MSELHLDLCRQSTAHLKETIASIREQLRILEVFVNSGLSDDARNSISNITSTSDPSNITESFCGESGESGIPSSSGRPSRREEPKGKTVHKGCCCMCPTRAGRNIIPQGSRISSNVLNQRRTMSMNTRPVSMPRLNRTASLRRDTAVERAQREIQSTSR